MTSEKTTPAADPTAETADEQLWQSILAIHSSLSMRDVHTLIAEHGKIVSGADGCLLYSRNDAGGELVWCSSGRDTPPPQSRRLPDTEGISGWVARHADAVAVDTAANDARFSATADQIPDIPTGPLLAVPLRQAQGTIGVLEAVRAAGKAPFSATQKNRLQRLADQAAAAMINARLHAEIQAATLDKQYGRAGGANDRRTEVQLPGLLLSISHDFKNIIGSIIGFTDLLLMETQSVTSYSDLLLADAQSAHIHTGLEGIRTACDKAMTLIDQIHAFTQKDLPQKVALHSSEIFRQALKLFRINLPGNITITHAFSPDTLKLMANPSQLHQAVIAILHNARNAIGEHPGKIAVHWCETTLTGKETNGTPRLAPGSYVVLTVTVDSSPAASEAVDRAPAAAAAETADSDAIALETSRKVFSELGGEMVVSIAPEGGTTVTVYLPLIADSPRRTAQPFSRMPKGNERILVIDDEKLLASTVARMLTSLGYHVTKVNSSREALNFFKEFGSELDLIISDWAMPEIKGDRLAQMMLGLAPGTKVILYSAFDSDLDKTKLKEMGIQDFLSKPVSLKELALTVRSVLDRR